MPISFGPWRPDVAAINADVMVNVRNVLPHSQGFTPLKSPKAVSDPLSEVLDEMTELLVEDEASAGNFTYRVVIPAANLIQSAEGLKIAFQSGSTGPFNIVEAWVGHAGPGDPYDFETTPTPILFNGGRPVTLPGATTVVSDLVDFIVDPAKNLVVSYFLDVQAMDMGALTTSPFGVSTYKRNATGNDSATVDADSNYSVQGKDNIGIGQLQTFDKQDVIGAGFLLDSEGGGRGFAGSTTDLFELNDDGSWRENGRGTPYNVPLGERWRFDLFGTTGLCVNGQDELQFLDIDGVQNDWADVSTDPGFTGVAPKPKYIAIVRDFAVVGNNLVGSTLNANEVIWSGLGRFQEWDPGINSSGNKFMNYGGPVRGLLGGEVGYIFQRRHITRMVFTTGAEVFQFDEVESNVGLLGPNTLAKHGKIAAFLSEDGFYALNIDSGSTQPIGAQKTDRFFFDDKRGGEDLFILGTVDPVNKLVFWAYKSKSSNADTPDRIIVYDWVLQEWSLVDIPISTFTQSISIGVSLDGLDVFGPLDLLPFSLDSSVWAGGEASLGFFGATNQLSSLIGDLLAATLEKSDQQLNDKGRVHISGIAPLVDTPDATVAVSGRERLADPVSYAPNNPMETTGICGANTSGRFTRIRVDIPEGAIWELAQGMEIIARAAGSR